jgi:rubrerythrin
LQGEALAHLKYQWYKKKLTEFNQGYENILNEIIHNEKEHGEIWFKSLHNNELPDNLTTLTDAISGEHWECHKKYTSYGRTARTEGFNDIAELFFKIAEIECHHAETFKEIHKEITNGKIFIQDKDTSQWKCLNCGHITDGKTAPTECPVCKHPQKYFIKEE